MADNGRSRPHHSPHHASATVGTTSPILHASFESEPTTNHQPPNTENRKPKTNHTDHEPLTTHPTHILVGTAGHVDHGKTRLVARLTGIDTDRLPEEKSRGISIDLGFAHWEAGGFRFGVVDVPGHERFVRHMVAGATGVNVALLVVAADDGVMPQTREHLDVMDLLGLAAGVVAVTKCDLVDEETRLLVREEVFDLVRGTFLEPAEVVEVSSETGAGLAELEAALVRTAERGTTEPADDRFRLPIDRAFTLPGHGTIVTGSSLSGTVHPGETLVLLPAGRDVRVRSVENHGDESDTSGPRRRTAINLAGVSLDEVSRGMELATPGTLEPTRRLVVRLRALGSSPIEIRNRQELRLHLGTCEVTARVIVREGPLRAGATTYAELRTFEPVVAEYGQRFILRRPSPATTIAGGTVLDPRLPDRRRLRDLAEYARALDTPDPLARLATLLAREDDVAALSGSLAARIGVTSRRVPPLLAELRERGDLVPLPHDRIAHADRIAAVQRSVVRTIEREVERHRPRRTLPRDTVRSLCEGIASPPLVEAALAAALAAGELVAAGENVGPAGLAISLTKRERAALDAALAEINACALQPPALRELAESTGLEAKRLAVLLDTCADDGRLVRISEQLWLPVGILDRQRSIVVDILKNGEPATLSQLREAWGVTRKWGVPLAEFFDATGLTRRDGDLRRLAPGAERTPAAV
jgi:selenocysteine-specific elongation factor